MYITLYYYFINTNSLEMKDYFKRLKEHPGLGFGLIFTLGIYAAALCNKNLPTKAALILGSIGAGIIWLVILTSVRKK
jgi:hypothetical protein